MSFDILITGDFYVGTHAGGRLLPFVVERNAHAIFGELLPILQDSKVTVINLEAPIVAQHSPIDKTGPNLQMPLKVIEVLTDSGINVACLANNHIMDHGISGLESTLDILKANHIDVVGADIKEELKQKSLVKEINGQRIGFLNICENEWISDADNQAGANGLDEVSFYYQIKELKLITDFIFVIFHGGNEYYPLPSPRIKKLMRYFVDLGADAVVGHHTHTFSGFEIYNGKPIYYSLGNFIFDSQKNTKGKNWHHGLAVGFDIAENKIIHKIIPFKQHSETLGVQILKGQELTDFEQELQRYNAIIQEDELLQESYVGFANQKTLQYQSFLNPYEGKLSSLFKKGILPSVFSKNKSKLLLNLIRCESHREILEIILQKRYKK